MRIVLHIDPDREPDRARQAFESHLARAKWMAKDGYRHDPAYRQRRANCKNAYDYGMYS